MELNFYSLSSGSSGNCYFLGNKNKGILIDAGIPAGKVRKFLKDYDIPIQSVMGVLISHNHSDHIRGLELLTRKNKLPVFTTEKIWESILSRKIHLSGARIHKIHLQPTHLGDLYAHHRHYFQSKELLHALI